MKATIWHRSSRLLITRLVLAVAGAAAARAQTAPPASAPRPDLTGTVSAKGGGPLAAKATVFIATAAPKTGTSTFCPSCYADCAKQARADAQGRFRIASLSPELTFQVLAVAKGYQPKSVSKVDPAKGPVAIALSPLADGAAAPDRSLRGRVVDAKGRVVAGAVVEMVGTESSDGGGSYGALAGIDPLAVTDDTGEFLITSRNPFELMDVKVTARGLADRSFTRLPAGKANELVMTEGATITGRVLAAGKPLAGVVVGISGVDRAAGVYVGHFEIGTDDQGKFAFYNVPPAIDYWIYTCLDSMQPWGATELQRVHSGKDGETTSVKDMPVVPAHRLAGRVVLSDGQPLPPQVRLLVGREEAWDAAQLTLDAQGRFDTPGIPGEQMNLSLRVKGYHISARNRSLDAMNPFQLAGRVERDITNLVVLLEPGPESRPDYQHGVDPEYMENRKRPLRGAEGGEDHAEDWTIAGSVTDSKSGEPVAGLQVTPGQAEPYGGISWSPLRHAEGSNGTYRVYLSKHWTRPHLKVEADGYLPLDRELPSQDNGHLDLVLQRGRGPSGKVVLPNGQPAVGAAVVLLTGGPNDAAVNAKGELTAHGSGVATDCTDEQGGFSLRPVLGMKTVAIGSSNGVVVASLAALATNATITLPPFGGIYGTLKRASTPGTNETLDVAFAGGEAGGLNLWLPAHTDQQGRFRFEHVPAGRLRISSRVPVGNNGWMNEPLQEVEVPPGKAVEVNLRAADLNDGRRTRN